ncbi:MAG: DUF3515 domain-containing protein [Nocardioides sp.]
MSLWTRGVVMSGLALLVSSCTGAVEIDSPDVDAETRSACARFLDVVPEKVSGERQRQTEPNDALGAAWGDPPIVVTCGVDMPEDFDEFSPCEEVDGVGWFIPEEAYTHPDDIVSITTIGWSPAVRIEVPAEYRPPADVLVEIGAAVKKSLTRTRPCV